jgi:hypothetical protein
MLLTVYNERQTGDRFLVNYEFKSISKLQIDVGYYMFE